MGTLSYHVNRHVSDKSLGPAVSRSLLSIVGQCMDNVSGGLSMVSVNN